MEDSIWYVEARKSKESQTFNCGTAVAIWLKSGATDIGKRYLVTCAHVIRDEASDGKAGYGPMLEHIRVWKPDSGYNTESGLAANVVKSDVIEFSKEEVAAVDRGRVSDDWVLLQVDDSRFANVPVVSKIGGIATEGLRILGYPGGDETIKLASFKVEPRETLDFRIIADDNGVLSLTGPEETRKGMSGGGLFGPDGALLGIHRAYKDLVNAGQSVSAKHIKNVLTSCGLTVVESNSETTGQQWSSLRTTDKSTERDIVVDYSGADVVRLLQEALDDDQLGIMCLTEFPDVYNKFSRGMSRSQKLEEIYLWANRQYETHRLLQLINESNRNRYLANESKLVEIRVKSAMPGAGSTVLPVIDSLAPLLARLLTTDLKNVQKAARVALPTWQSFAFTNPDKGVQLFEAVGHLATRGRSSDGTFPLLRFLKELAQLASPDIAREIEKWIQKAVERLLPDDEATRHTELLDQPVNRQGSDTCRIVIQIETEEDGLYPVNAWMLGFDVDPPAIVDMIEYDGLPEILDRLRDSLFDQDIGLDSVFVEFFLPKQLFNWAVDQLPVTSDPFVIPIGSNHIVVLRSEKRAGKCQASYLLERRWRKLASEGVSQEKVLCRFAESLPSLQEHRPFIVGINPAEQRARSLHQGLLNRASIVGGIFAAPPRIEPKRIDVLDAVISSGIPVALWLRECPASDECLEDLFKDSSLQSILDWVFAKRREAAEADADLEDGRESDIDWHVGRHAAVLWDDPDRPLPPHDGRFRCQSPNRT